MKAIFTSFGQNTAKKAHSFNHIMICIFWQEFGLKPCYFHYILWKTEVFENIVPPPWIQDHINSVHCI